MATLKQLQLVRQAEIFITNGAKPEAQAVLANIGYVPATLSVGQVLVDTVKNEQAQTKVLLTQQKNATSAEQQARLMAQREVSSLSETARLLFAEAGATLTALGLQTQYEMVTDPETGEQTQQAARRSRSTADLLGYWRLLVTNAMALEGTAQDELAAAGWGAARLTALAALIEAYAMADTVQRDAVQNYQQANAQFMANKEALKRWYGRARRLALVAIKDNDPGNQQNLRDLLGLNG